MHNDTTVFVGLDIQNDSITTACVGSSPGEQPHDLGTCGTQQYAIDRLIKKLSGRGPLQFVYEAGPCGFWLERYLRSKGERCLVAAPSLIPKRPGERIKTDRRDARISPWHCALALSPRCTCPPPTKKRFATSCALGSKANATSPPPSSV